MAKGILSERFSTTSSATDTGSVALEFCGVFRNGPRAGELFGGTIRYPIALTPTECHAGFAMFDDRHEPIMTVLVAGRRMSAQSASVYSAIPDGAGNAMDLVTFAGEGDAAGSVESVELMLAQDATDWLDPRRMPTAAQLQAMTVKRLLYAAPGQSPSSGDLLFGAST